MGQFDECKWVLEQLCVLQVAIFEHAVFELLGHLDFFLVYEAVAYADDRLLHLFSKFDSSLEYGKVVLAEIEGIVCNPEVIIKASLDHIKPLRCSFFLSLFVLDDPWSAKAVWVNVLGICGNGS